MEIRDRQGVFNIFQLVETFREIHPEMPIQMATVFLLIAMKPGITQGELLSLMDISQSGISRNVLALCAVNRHGKPGLDLVAQRSAAFDARTSTLHLTVKGQAFLERLLSIGRREAEGDGLYA